MQFITITGNLGQDPKLAQTRNSDEVCNLSVGVRQGWGDREQTNWYRVSVWGKRAKHCAEYLRKGAKVTVVGDFSIGEYEGKPQYEVRAFEVDWPPTGHAERKQERQSDDGLSHRNRDGFGGSSAPSFVDDLNDDVPFLSADFAHEVKRRRII